MAESFNSDSVLMGRLGLILGHETLAPQNQSI
jgi:hypothetical protein